MVTKKNDKQAVRRSAKGSPKRASGSIFARLARIGATVPDADWDKLPRDSAKNLDHYLHGSPREQ